MKQYAVRKKEIKELIAFVERSFGTESAKNVTGIVERLELESYTLILVNHDFFLVEKEKEFFPHLKAIIEGKFSTIKKVVVDMGAIKFVTNGADVMKPGIKSADPEINEGDIIVIVEETHNKPLAVGKAIVKGAEMVGNSGKGVTTLHYVSDAIWSFEKKKKK